MTISELDQKEDLDNNPLRPFLFALKAPESKRQYPKRLKIFFDFGFDKNLTLVEQANLFIEKCKNNEKWSSQYFIKFIEYQNDRVRTNEISPSTIPNYYKAAKLFCIMNDITLNWQKIAKGLPERKRVPASIAESRICRVRITTFWTIRIIIIIFFFVLSFD